MNPALNQHSSVRGGALVIGGEWQMLPATLTRPTTRTAAMKRLTHLTRPLRSLLRTHRDLISDTCGALCIFATGYLIIVIFAALE